MEGATARGARTLCVFLDAPVDASTGSLRWRRLAQFVCSRGPATAVVIRDAAADDLSWLAAELGAEVVGLDMTRRGRSSGILRGAAGPWRSWPLTRADVVEAQAAIAAHLAGDEPDIIWCAGAEAWLALPKPLRHCAVVDLIDPPSRNRRELARVVMHRLGRRITHDRGVDASVCELTRDAPGGVRNRAVERHVAREAAAAVFASRTGAHGRGLRCVPTGVDDPGAVRPPADPDAAPYFVFPGSFLHPSHQDAAEWFALYVLPPLRRLLPACRVVFAGECPDWMWSFGQTPRHRGDRSAGRLGDRDRRPLGRHRADPRRIRRRSSR